MFNITRLPHLHTAIPFTLIQSKAAATLWWLQQKWTEARR
jgi:hypothetical protein